MLETVLIVGLIVCYLWGINVSDNNKSEYISLENSTRIKGFFALVILAHHIIQFGNDHNGIILHRVGYIGVAVFFFYSGYGLMYKLRNDENYLDNYFKKRLLKIIYPSVIVYALYVFEDYLMGRPHSIIDVLKSLVNGVPIGVGTWYMIFIIVFYCYFWLVSIIAKRNIKKVIVAIGLFVVLWIIGCNLVGYGQVWFVSSLSLFVGACWDEVKGKVHEICDKNYIVTLLISSFVFIILEILVLNSHGDTPLYFIYQIVGSTVFVILLQVLNYKIQNKGKILDFLGGLSLEIFMVHGFFAKAFLKPLLGVANGVAYAIAVIACSIMAGYLFHLLIKRINKIIL